MSSSFAELELNIEPLGRVSGFVDEFVEAVTPRPFFADFSRIEATVLSGYLDCYGVPAGAVVLREGDEGSFLAILLTGRAIISKIFDDADRLLHEMSTGEMVGEMSLIDGQPRFASCVAIEPSDFAVLSREDFEALLNEHPKLGSKLLRKLLELSTARLRDATLQMLPGLLPWSA
jgi:CRP-like cAMP-binding protein